MNKVNVNDNMSAALNILCNCTNAYNEINMVIAYHDRVISSEIAERSKACHDFLSTRYQKTCKEVDLHVSRDDLFNISMAVNKQQLYRILIDKIYESCTKYSIENELRRILFALKVLMI